MVKGVFYGGGDRFRAVNQRKREEAIRRNPDYPHGSRYGYREMKCRCEKCRTWKATDLRVYRVHAPCVANAKKLTTDNATLRAALAPFVKFMEAWDAQPILGIDDLLYRIHTGTEWEASLKLSDFRAARDAVKKMEER